MKKSYIKIACAVILALILMLPIISCGSVNDTAGDDSEYIPPATTEKVMHTESRPVGGTVETPEAETGEACEHEYENEVCIYCEAEYSAGDGLHFISNGDGTCRVAGTVNLFDAHIVIPPVSPAGDKVTVIGYRAFAWYEPLESIFIPESVTVIDKSAFHDCLILGSVVFENTEGWTRDGKPVDVTDPARNAQLLMHGEKWERK